MFEPLTIQRFRALADAYGGVIARWPNDVADEALRFSRTPEGSDVLAEALVLDEMLDLWSVPAPSALLAKRIALGVPRPSLVRSAKLWWYAVGLAAALSGATAGIAATLVVSPVNHADSMTVFGDLPGGSDDHG